MPSDAYLGEVTLFAGDYAPAGSAECLGYTMPIAQNRALFSVLGTTYGGDGSKTFRLPDFRGAVATGEQNSDPGGLAEGRDVFTVPVTFVIALEGTLPARA